jgi:FixJ family two-component response regulator
MLSVLLPCAATSASRATVLTTTNVHHLNTGAGRDTGAIEFVGKPYDLQTIADAVSRGIEDGGRAPLSVVDHKRQ